MAAGARWATRANALTLGRAASAPALALAIAGGHALAAGALFAFAALSDLADGRIARRFGEASPLGGLLDHASDALCVTAGLGALVAAGEVPLPLPWLVAAAFLQYVVDSRVAGSEGLRASPLGRWNGIAYFVLVGIPVVRDALGLAWPGLALVRALGWVLVASTLVSMADRALALRRALRSRRGA
jgi:phosphatidylglycerophosphate synthase